MGLNGGGAGMSSPSNLRPRTRATAPNLRTTSAEIPQKMPFSSMGTRKATAPNARGRLERVWPSSFQARRVKGASITRRSGDAADSVMM